MCNDLVHLLILLSCTNYTLYSCYYYLIHGAVLHTAISIKVKLRPFSYMVGLASHLTAEVSLQHRGYGWNQNNPLLLPTSFLDVLNIVRSVYNVTVWKVPSPPYAASAFPPSNAERLLPICITSGCVYAYLWIRACCVPRVPVPVLSKLALKCFSIRENQEEAGNGMH